MTSPMLANLYMNRFLKYWRLQQKGNQWRTHIIAYADDFVILSCGYAEQARDWTQQVMRRIGLTLNEQKTSIRDARSEEFDFLGYTFGRRYCAWNGRSYMAALLMSGEGKPPAASRPRSGALPRLHANG